MMTYDEYLKRGLEGEIKGEDAIVDYNNKDCVDCDECCAMFTLITQSEYDDLEKYFKKNKIGQVVYKKAVDRVLSFDKEIPNAIYLKCPLLNRKKKCDIYNSKKRPSICKEFHCSKELNTLDDKLNQRNRMIFELFSKDLMKSESYKNKLNLFMGQLNKDVFDRNF